MYCLINENIEVILDIIPVEHVNEYDWLIQHLPEVQEQEYQQRYRIFWGLNRGTMEQFRNVYFQLLQECVANQTPPELGDVQLPLYQQRLEFSFASKLAHMVNQNLPIYDSKVAAFFFFRSPNADRPLQQRVDTYMGFYHFLERKYQRIQNEGLLAESIQVFREHFHPENFTSIKVIDSLIWAFVKCCSMREITYA